MPLTGTVIKTLEKHYIAALENNNTLEILHYLDQLLAEFGRFALGQAIHDLYQNFKDNKSPHKAYINRSLIEYSLRNNIKKITIKDFEEALRNKEIREIGELLSESVDLFKNLSSKDKFLLLDSAIGHGKKIVFTQLLAFLVQYEKREDLISIINYTDNESHPLLVSICLSYNDIQTVEDLLRVGANINVISQKLDNVMINITGVVKEVLSPSGWIALHGACMTKNFRMVQFLVNHGAEVSMPTSEHVTPLHMACLENQVDIVTLLLDKGASKDIFKEDVLHHMPLFIAFAIAITKRDDTILNIFFEVLSLETKNKNIEHCIKCFSDEINKQVKKGDSYFITLRDKISQFQLNGSVSSQIKASVVKPIAEETEKIPASIIEEKESNKKRRKKKRKPTENVVQEIAVVSNESKEEQQSENISTEKIQGLFDIPQSVVDKTSIASAQEIAFVPDEKKEEQQSESIPTLEDKETVSLSNNNQKKLAKNPKKIEKLLFQIHSLTEKIDEAQTVEELDNSLFLLLERYENKNKNNPDATLSKELARIRNLALTKMIQLVLNDMTQTIEQDVLTSELKQEVSSILNPIMHTEHNESQENKEKEELMSLGSTSSEAVSNSLDEEFKPESDTENIIDFHEPALQPACLKNTLWQEAFALLTEIVKSLHYKIFLYGSANYKYNPNDFDLVVYGLSEEEWEIWEKIVLESKNNLSILEKIPLLKHIKDKNGIIECAYKKNEYNGMIIKTSFMIQGRRISWDFSVLPPKMTMKAHADKLDISIGAMYFDILKKKMFCPIPGTKDHLKQGILWAIQNPYHMFRNDPSVILRLMRILASTREYIKNSRLANKVWKAINEVFNENAYLLNMKVEGRTDYGAADKCYHEMELLFKPGHALKTLQVLHEHSLVCSFFTHLIGISDELYNQTFVLMQEVAKLFDSAASSVYYEETKSELFYQRFYNSQGQFIERALYPSLMYHASCWFLQPNMSIGTSYIHINREITNYKCPEYKRNQVNTSILQELSPQCFLARPYPWQNNFNPVSPVSYASFYQPAAPCVPNIEQHTQTQSLQSKG